MKKIFFIVLLANVIVFALIKFGWIGRGDQVREAQAPLNAEMIRLVDKNKIDPVKSRPSPLPVSPENLVLAPPKQAQQPSVSTASSAGAEKIAYICMEWGDFSGSDLERATAALAALKLGDKLSQREIEHETGYWVYMPPLKNKKAINQKIGELRELGVTEYFVVTAGRWRNAISLGVFKTREAAQNLFDQLRTKGVRSAKIGERASKLKTTMFVLNGISPEKKANLLEIQKDFAGSELGDVPCTLTR